MAKRCPTNEESFPVAPERPQLGGLDNSGSAVSVRLRPHSLAQTSGVYWEQPPPEALASHFKCLWVHRMPTGSPANIAIVPDGCSDIIWSSKGLALVGPDRVAALITVPAGETIIGARFRVGAAASWLRTPLHEITGRTVPFDELWGRSTDETETRMREAADVPERLRVLAADLLQRRATSHSPPADLAACIARIEADQLTSGDPIRALLQEIGISERTLRRHCHEHLGYGAKTLDRILRLQRFLTGCRCGPANTLASLALEAGYSDQAHLAREARTLTSFTPREIKLQLTGRPGSGQVGNLRSTI
ncbi:helix-turn-helix domain-containing protein [Sinorhizobium medicae]|uniref:Helix-turn-helix domain-containing protein n=1 Tax=Sinorhizobium medicae TaxID=110321 RepID=A0A6G1WIY6_9HYPH|nr:AraC family transcriptional regulator [Sinorhizobium medicae]MQW69656.1 helix-turn-helix domain-containing protein [Sinorhizobium medicae]MQX82716.1 helix-turn-helix domain-containing protein [Sinorhizobium medicae]